MIITADILFHIFLIFLLFHVQNRSIWSINTPTSPLFGIVFENSVSNTAAI